MIMYVKPKEYSVTEPRISLISLFIEQIILHLLGTFYQSKHDHVIYKVINPFRFFYFY